MAIIDSGGPQFPVSDTRVDAPRGGVLETELEKPVKIKITLVVEFDAASLDDIAEVKETMDEAVDVLCGLGEMVEAECKEEIIAAT